VALRVGFSALLLVVVTGAWRLRLPREQWGNLAGYGICLGLMNSVAYQAFARVPIGIAMAIEVMGPLTLVILGSRHVSDFLWLGWHGGRTCPGAFSPAGRSRRWISWDWASPADSATCWAGVHRVRFAPGEGRQRQCRGCGGAIAAIFVVPLGVAGAGATMFTPELLALGWASRSSPTRLPYFLQMLAMRQLPRALYGVIAGGVPAVGAAMSWLVLGEQLGGPANGSESVSSCSRRRAARSGRAGPGRLGFALDVTHWICEQRAPVSAGRTG